MKVNCLSCGFTVALDAAYSDYDGQVRCYVCGAVLHIKTEDGMLRSVEALPKTSPSPTEEVVEHRS